MTQYDANISNEYYRISVTEQGIFLKRIGSNNDEETLCQLPSVENKYNLIYALLDGLTNRFLIHNFSWEQDLYATHLRIALAILAPTLSLSSQISKDSYLRQLSGNVSKFDVEEFILLKHFLDNTGGKQGQQVFKNNVLNIGNNDFYSLTDYASDDSEEESDTENSGNTTQLPIALSVQQENAGYHKFMEYLEGKSENFPKKCYTVPNVDLPESMTDEVNTLLVREFNKFGFDSPQKSNTQEQLPNDQILIPGFRGINHMQGRFSNKVRRLLRKTEIQLAKTRMPYFSEAVLKTHFDFYRDAEQFLQLFAENSLLLPEVVKTAQELQNQLISIQQTHYILIKGLTGKELFNSLLDALHHIYTNGIIRFQHLLRQMQTDLNIDFQHPNSYNPFVSESENPYNAFHYLFGMKSPYTPAALLPRYHNDGQPSYPYLGEIDITERDVKTIMTHEGRRLLVREKKDNAALRTSFFIGPELEATALSYLPEGQVVHSEVIRCPNFSGNYKKVFQEKYGFSKVMFDLFKKRITSSEQGSPKRKETLDILFEWLSCYHTVRLIEKAKQLATAKGAKLAFLTKEHGITSIMPNDDVSLNEVLNEKCEKIAVELSKKCDRRKKDSSSPVLKTKITTKEQRFYEFTEEEVSAAGKRVGLTTIEINELLFRHNAIRTPPSQRPLTRSPVSSGSRRIPGSPYHYGSSIKKILFPEKTDLELNHEDREYTGEQMNQLMQTLPRQEDDLILDAMDAMAHQGEGLTINLYDQLIQQVLSESQGNSTTRRINIPINLSNLHWVVLSINFESENRAAPIVRYLDPLGNPPPTELSTAITKVFSEAVFNISEQVFQNDNINCGPWVIELFRAILSNSTLPDASLDIEAARESHEQQLTEISDHTYSQRL